MWNLKSIDFIEVESRTMARGWGDQQGDDMGKH